MAKIVGVHGIGQQLKGEHSLRSEWLPALRDGLARAGRELTDENDFVCAFYGDLFRPKGKSINPPLGAGDVTDPKEIALLEAWWNEAAAIDPRIPGPDARTKFYTPQLVQRALNALSHLPFFKGITEAAMIFDLKQVRLYMNDASVHAEVQKRLATKVSKDTHVLIGHSLGSVVAYEALCAHPEWPVNTLITLGSPLGIRNLIFDCLKPAPRDGLGSWPGNVQRWVNIFDRGDVVALVKDLKPLFGRAGVTIEDISIDNGATAHGSGPYLTAKETGDAIASAL